MTPRPGRHRPGARYRPSWADVASTLQTGSTAASIPAALGAERDAGYALAMLLLLGTGQRCGSTLVQRLLCSHPDAFIWGEHGGDLEGMLTAAEGVAAYAAGLGGQAARKDWAELGHQGFIANLTPD